MYFDGEKPYEIDNTELSSQSRLDLWQTGFGLQAVDGLKPSKYMVELAEDHINGRKTYEEVDEEINRYYATDKANDSTREADIVSLRIAELLSDNHFILSPATLIGIHRHLFTGVFEGIPVGKFRTVNITKDEAVLNNQSVQYASHFMIKDTINYDFDAEKTFQFEDLSKKEVGKHIMSFISDVWQIHPFREGNTRTIAVFTIQYLRSFGFKLNNESFKQNSAYFRDALVLDNSSKPLQTNTYLELFTDNILFNQKHNLDTEDMIKRTVRILKLTNDEK